MKLKNNVNQLHPEVDMLKAILLKSDIIGKSKIDVYVEELNLSAKENHIEYDFAFLINGEYYRGNEKFTISDLYKVYNTVYSSFIEFIEKQVLTSSKSIDIFISVCAGDKNEMSAKNRLYKRIIKKLTNKYKCQYSKTDDIYVLSFTK